MELHRKHRPRTLEDVVGQPSAVKALTEMVRKGAVPQAILFHGSASGIGKTTLARILAREVGCPPSRKNPDFQEINAASSRGIDTIRDVEASIGLYPMSSKKRVVVWDEVHELSSRKQGSAQSAFLKVLEELPEHAHFFLCTTHIDELLPTIKTRCIKVKLDPVGPEDMAELVARVAKLEGIGLSGEVLKKIVEMAEGSPREALGRLELVAAFKSDRERLDALQSEGSKEEAISLARALMAPGGHNGQWNKVAAILEKLEEEPEGIRRLVLAYARKVLLGGGRMAGKAFLIISAFEKNFYDGGHASLAAAAWDVLGAKE